MKYEYKNKVTIDILSGEGPDVLLLSHRWFDSVNKLSANGVLCDLNEFIKKDKGFKMSDYNEKILNSFEKDGKRLIIPLDYCSNILITSREALERNNIKIDLSNWSLSKLVGIVKKYQDEEKGKKNSFTMTDSIYNLIDCCGYSFVDYQNKKSRYNSDDFVKILQNYKEIYPSILRREEKEDDIKNGIYVMKADFKVSPYFVSNNYHVYKEAGREMEIYPFPAFKGGTSNNISFTYMAAGINSQSRSKETAYEFIKLLMTKDLQRMDQFKNISPGIPVNIKLRYKEDAELFF
jgi:ABC-type glycerol-3-phosphate transport system substrate-binding protein